MISCSGFVDTPEVENICEFIGSQRAYPDAHMLPEYEGESEGSGTKADLDDKDEMFNQAAEIVVKHQNTFLTTPMFISYTEILKALKRTSFIL